MIRKLILITAAFLLSTSANAAPNLVTNGSFELGPAGLGSFDDWTVVAGDPSTFVDSDGQTGPHYGQASDGLWSAFFGSTAADGGASITQTLTTVSGQRYVLGFDLANDNGGMAAVNQFVASINGIPLYPVTNALAFDYGPVSVTFLATSASTILRFAASNDNGYFDLDRVTVTAVPEPETALLAAAGLLALGLQRRRTVQRGAVRR